MRGNPKEDNLNAQILDLQNKMESLGKLYKEEGGQQRSEQENLNRGLRMELNNSITGLSDSLKTETRSNREELSKTLNNLTESLTRRMQDSINTQQTSMDTLKNAMDAKMEQIRKNNETKLEEMRKTVDEKLHETLEKRLGDSFKIVSERLEEVHKGLGEMKGLASSVGDLKKVLSNVKTIGILGEVQLANILEQMLTPEQYEANFKPNKRRNEVVEFAIRLPGRSDDQEAVYLPIDSKFPIADYQRMVEASEKGDLAAMETHRRALVASIKSFARDIRDKYLNPPITTDFALLFLPLEGLYAEVLKDPELFETMRRDYHIIVVGPSTTAAILNSLQMGFRTLAIEKRSSEVWKLLGAIKLDFGKFGKVLEATQKKLDEASKQIGNAQHRSRQITKKLNRVQELPSAESKPALPIEAELVDDEDDDEDETQI
ncbi:MAG: DNA recombination protein RmuC [Candidatus Cloacimonetes bacterium]|nr:DNA recombination protein RmuC [Candidatus Cloacimonadota bacterium]